MSADPPGYLDYVKAAFHASPRIKGLGNVPVNWLGVAAFATLGLLNPGFWLVGAGLELAFLASLSNNQRFQSYVRGKRLADARRSDANTALYREAQRVAWLEPDTRDRYVNLRGRIANSPTGATGAGSLIADAAREGLAALQVTFLELGVARSRLSSQAEPAVRRAVRQDLDTEIRTLEGLDADADPRMRRSVEGTVEILRKRLDNLDTAAKDVAYLDSELRRIEAQVALVLEEASLADDPAKLTRRIDEVSATFDDTRDWMRKHRDLLDAIDPDDDDDGPSAASIARGLRQSD